IPSSAATAPTSRPTDSTAHQNIMRAPAGTGTAKTSSACSPTIRHALIGNECSAKQKKRDPKLKGGPWNTVLFFLNKSPRPAEPGRITNLLDSRVLPKPVNWYQGGSI